MNATNEQVAGAVRVTAAIAEAIREARQIPSGKLYAVVCGSLSLETYNRVIDTLKRAGIVTESGHVLTWTGGDK